MKINVTNLLNAIVMSKSMDLFNYFIDNFTMYMQNVHLLYMLDVIIRLSMLSDEYGYNCTEMCEKILALNLDTCQLNNVLLDIPIKYLNISIVKILINYGLDVNSKTLHEFVERENVDVIDYLIKYGIEPSDETIFIVFQNHYDSVIKIFLENKINLSCLGSKEYHTKSLEKFNDCGITHEQLLLYLLNRFDNL